MHPEIARLLEQAEQRYLQTNELELFRRYAVSLARRMEAYEILRDKEEQIFQPVADRLVATFPDEPQDLLVRSLKHWLLISRYCGTAMLLSDPDFLALRLNDWMTGFVHTHQTQTIERQLYELLLEGIKAELSDKHFPLIQPLFAKAKAMLLEEAQPQ